MRYLAILKDSFREAMDCRVLSVLFLLSTAAILAVATLSFRPLSAQATMEQFFPNEKLEGLSILSVALYHQDVNHNGKNNGEADILDRLQLLNEFRLEKVELLHGEDDSPESDYVLTLVQTFVPARQEKGSRQGAARARLIFQRAENMGFVRVGDIAGELVPDEENGTISTRARYRVALHGTARTHRIWAHEPSFFFGAVPIESLSAPLGYQLYVLVHSVVSIGAWVAILVGVVITSFFIPNMLGKGTIDLLLVKPIQRWVLLLYKYAGGLTFVVLNGVYATVGVWLVLGLRTGVWAHGLLLLIFTLTFFFAVLYAVSTLVSIVTRSTIATIILTISAWFLCFVVGAADKHFELKQRVERQEQSAANTLSAEQRSGASSTYLAIAKVIHVLHAVTPQTEELNRLNERVAYAAFLTGVWEMREFDTGDPPCWESMLVSAAWIILFLGLACLRFSYRDL